MLPARRCLLALLLLATPAALAQERPAQPGPGNAPPVSVTTAPATVGDVPVEVVSNGIGEATRIISVRARVDGAIEQVHVREGEVVREGQVLFTLDSRTSQALLAQQQAILERDRAQLTRARADAQRYASLRSDAYASAQRAEQAQADATALAATVRADEAVVQQTQLSLDFATIRAEGNGRLGALPVKAGNFVRASEGVVLATITETDPILVTFSVPERWLGELRAARARGETPKVRARAPEDGSPAAEGELVFVDTAVDSTTGTIRLKGRFNNAEGRFWPGQYLEVTLIPRTDPNTLSVPAAAVQRGAEGSFLFAVKPDGQNGIARRVPVRVSRYASGRAVLDGAQVANNEPVVTEGAQRLQDGARVALRQPGGDGERPRAGGEPRARGDQSAAGEAAPR
ncbi:efflux RND transporter periplasmic adaptor subunit [Roseomonas sp. BN140053]|uniref:efflux RND transporter periplasmic adaptor subunit n=1 Tax=Roseomonas sp. BN140053 TaxID=3391898 RepID=UPI0039E86975